MRARLDFEASVATDKHSAAGRHEYDMDSFHCGRQGLNRLVDRAQW